MLLDGPAPLETASKDADMARLSAAVIEAEEDLADLLAGADPLDVALKTNQVALAKATLADAQETLAELAIGPDPLQVAVDDQCALCWLRIPSQHRKRRYGASEHCDSRYSRPVGCRS